MPMNNTIFTKDTLKYLGLLSRQYPDINSASTEIINLQAILNLPKGTEHFVSDLHGEFDAFNHVIKNASGVIKNKIKDIFGTTLREDEKSSLATLIYYPKQKLEHIKQHEKNLDDWYKITLHRLIQITRVVASKYTRSKLRKALPKDFAYVLYELLHEDEKSINKEYYYNGIVDTIIRLDRADAFIVEISELIQRLAIDRLHVVGDIYDRGPAADRIMDLLCEYHSVDIQWGNHDIVWMGAAAGSEACICNVIRFCARYGNLDTLEDGYGINILNLATFAMDIYGDDDCKLFKPKSFGSDLNESETVLLQKIHKAISVLQFKLEGKIIINNPGFLMKDRLLLDKIDISKNTVKIGKKSYKILDSNFPTIDWKNPYDLTPEENVLISKLVRSFVNSSKLQEHVKLLFNKGSLYKISNGNLLFHGCIPMTENSEFRQSKILDKAYQGKEYFDELDRATREGFFSKEGTVEKAFGKDLMWYLWCGKDSPLFGKDKMATFERYFVEEKETHKEIVDPYFAQRDNVKTVNKILKDFGINGKNAHIINGHLPVKVSKGENPIKANGKLYDIDGGFSKAYQDVTGIAGYTLIFNSYGLILVSHGPFISLKKAIRDEEDILSSTVDREYSQNRILIKDTDVGDGLLKNITDLELLLEAYKRGYLKEIEAKIGL